MIRNMILTAFVVVLATPLGTRAEGNPPAGPFDDATFVKEVAICGRYDAYLGELVGTQTRNNEVKNFAVRLVADHITASTGLKTAAASAGIELPTKLDDAHQKQYEAFKDYKGNNLDRDFVKAMVKSYTDGVAVFTRASKEAKNPAVKEFATKTLPTLQKNLETAKSLDK
jgi:putative membrane protein